VSQCVKLYGTKGPELNKDVIFGQGQNIIQQVPKKATRPKKPIPATAKKTQKRGPARDDDDVVEKEPPKKQR
jgi:hypothetical protein